MRIVLGRSATVPCHSNEGFRGTTGGPWCFHATSMQRVASTILQPMKMASAGPPHTYFEVAQSMLPGVKVRAVASPLPALALALVAAHVLECLVFAEILPLERGGIRCAQERPIASRSERGPGNGFHARPPGSGGTADWVDRLSGIHKNPFYLRYSTEVHGIVSPGAEPMTAELAALLEIVRGHLA